MSLYDSILITGAGGMLGHAFTDQFQTRGQGLSAISLPRAKLDISDESCLLNSLNQFKPTLILNCAAHTKVDLCESEEAKANAINGHAVGTMARWSRENECVLMHVSTDFVFDGSLRRPYEAGDSTHPLSAYGRSKLLGEIELQKNAPARWLIVRTAWVYGRHGGNFPRTMVQAARDGKPLSVVSDQQGTPTYTVDLAEGILNLLDAGASGIWHLSNSGETNWHEFAQATLAEFDISAPVTPVTSDQWKQMRPNTATRPGYSVLNIEPYTQKTGKVMRPWRAALVDFRRAVQQHGF
jgi:dTDP-4-dehydrorhamnose reductase